MEVDEPLLRKHIKALSNQELLRMLSEDAGQYRPEALALAKKECSYRRLSSNSVEDAFALEEKAKAKRLLRAIQVVTKAVIDAPALRVVRGAGLWHIFGAVQALGFFFNWFASAEGGYAAWFLGFILLLPGNLPTKRAHIWNFGIFLFITIVCNALVWLVCSRLWRRFQKSRQKMRLHRYTLGLTATGLVFVTANILYGPAYPGVGMVTYGIPFVFYYAHCWGDSILIPGLIANALVVLGGSVILGELWNLFSSTRRRVNLAVHQ